MDKEELIEILAQLYRLRDEGKNVDVAIEQVEDQLHEECENDTSVRNGGGKAQRVSQLPLPWRKAGLH